MGEIGALRVLAAVGGLVCDFGTWQVQGLDSKCILVSNGPEIRPGSLPPTHAPCVYICIRIHKHGPEVAEPQVVELVARGVGLAHGRGLELAAVGCIGWGLVVSRWMRSVRVG